MSSFRPAERRLLAVPVLLGLNTLVWLAWQLARGNPELTEVLAGHFLISGVHLSHGHWWTLVGAAFSHADLWHLALNMIVVFSFGSVLERLWGARAFTVFYLAAAVVASASHVLVTLVVLGRWDEAALGASGAASALLLTFSLLFPRHRILIMGVIPIPALAGALAFVAFDLWGLLVQSQGGGLPIGHGAHLGGAAFGAVAWAAWARPHFARARSLQHAVSLTPTEAAELERLREKLAHGGVEGLTPDERNFLRELHRRAETGT